MQVRSISGCLDGGRWLGDRDVGCGGEFQGRKFPLFSQAQTGNQPGRLSRKQLSILPSQLFSPVNYPRSSMRTMLGNRSAFGGHAIVRLSLRRSSGGHRKIVHHGSCFPYLSLCSHNVFICRQQLGR